MFHAHASVIFHATSSWLTVSLAQIRVLTIRRATLGPTQQVTERSTVLLAIATCILMALVNLPNFLTFEVMEVPARMFLTCMGAGEEPTEGVVVAEGNASAVYSSSSSSGLGEEFVYVVRAEENDCMKLRVSGVGKSKKVHRLGTKSKKSIGYGLWLGQRGKMLNPSLPHPQGRMSGWVR
jgi:Serpentine type 7TM GPCR chemoreceptor Srw